MKYLFVICGLYCAFIICSKFEMCQLNIMVQTTIATLRYLNTFSELNKGQSSLHACHFLNRYRNWYHKSFWQGQPHFNEEIDCKLKFNDCLAIGNLYWSWCQTYATDSNLSKLVTGKYSIVAVMEARLITRLKWKTSISLRVVFFGLALVNLIQLLVNSQRKSDQSHLRYLYCWSGLLYLCISRSMVWLLVKDL